MEKDILDGKLGEIGAYDLEFKGGKLLFKVSAAHSGFSASMEAAMDADAVLDLLAKKIPGQIDDALLNLMKAALKA